MTPLPEEEDALRRIREASAAPEGAKPRTPPDLAAPPADLREAVIEALQTCYDPEIPVNIYDLGLVYTIDVSPEGKVKIEMTLTSPACPVAETLPPQVRETVSHVPGVADVELKLVWEPPWGRHLLSEAARLQLGLDYY